VRLLMSTLDVIAALTFVTATDDPVRFRFRRPLVRISS
jgi:hypothetical protein